MFEFLCLLVFGVIGLRATGARRVASALLIALLFVMDSGIHTGLTL